MTELSKYNLEAIYRISKAIEHVETAMVEIDRACEQLSPIMGMIPIWKKAGSLYNQIRGLLDKLEVLRNLSKPWELDSSAMKWLDEHAPKEGEKRCRKVLSLRMQPRTS